MPPRVRLGRTHGRSNTPRHEIQAGADLSPRQPALRRSHKFTALTEFCKRLTRSTKDSERSLTFRCEMSRTVFKYKTCATLRSPGPYSVDNFAFIIIFGF